MRRSWRKGLAAVLCVAMAGGLLGCGNSTGGQEDSSTENIVETETASSKDRFTITFWTTGDVGINPQIEEWNEAHPTQQIELVTADSESLLANLKTALSAGAGLPDAVWVECDSIENFKQNPELWTNLLDYGAGELEGDYLPWKWQQAMSTDGSKLFGIPTDIGPMLLAYRTDIFEEAGLPTDREEVNAMLSDWEEFIKVGKTINEKTGSYLVSDSAYLFQVIVGQGTEKFFDKDDNLIVETNEQVKKAWNYAEKAADAGISANMDLWSPEWSTALGDGTLAAEICPAWMITHIKNYSSENAGNWDLTYLPEGGGNWGGSFACIPAAAEHPDEAYEFISSALSTDGQYASYLSNQLFPSAVGVYEMDEFKNTTDEFFNNAPSTAMFGQSAEEIQPAYEGIYSKDVLEIIKDAAARVEDGTQSSEDSWNQAMSEIERLMR